VVEEFDPKKAEVRFDAEMFDIYRKTGEAFGYWPNYFLRMVRNEGGVAAAKKLLADDQVSDGFRKLVKARRLDLSVEYHVLRPRYAPLFSREERTKARARLERYGVELPTS
jgi:hypothetical protein